MENRFTDGERPVCHRELPAALIVTVIAWAYVRFGKLPQAAGGFSLSAPALPDKLRLAGAGRSASGSWPGCVVALKPALQKPGAEKPATPNRGRRRAARPGDREG